MELIARLLLLMFRHLSLSLSISEFLALQGGEGSFGIIMRDNARVCKSRMHVENLFHAKEKIERNLRE